MNKETVIFHLRWIEDYEGLSDEQFGMAFRAAFGLGLPPSDPLAKRAYLDFSGQLKHEADGASMDTKNQE